MEESLLALIEEVKLLTKSVRQSLTDQDDNRKRLIDLSMKMEALEQGFKAANKRGPRGE